jgi:hypothetical protein
MKKLNKLQINSDRMLKNEELKIIRGGYGWCNFYYYEYNWGGGYFENQDECQTWVRRYFDPANICSCA